MILNIIKKTVVSHMNINIAQCWYCFSVSDNQGSSLQKGEELHKTDLKRHKDISLRKTYPPSPLGVRVTLFNIHKKCEAVFHIEHNTVNTIIIIITTTGAIINNTITYISISSIIFTITTILTVLKYDCYTTVPGLSLFSLPNFSPITPTG